MTRWISVVARVGIPGVPAHPIKPGAYITGQIQNATPTSAMKAPLSTSP